MRTMISGVLILILWGGVPALAQLPPEIQVDSYLLRAEQAIGEDDQARARAEIDKIILLQEKHELDLPNEFHFRYAKAAAAAGMPEEAHEAVVKYLMLAGREGQHYEEALQLLNQVHDAIEASKEPQEASNEPSPPAQEVSQAPVADQSGADETPEPQEDMRALVTAVAPTEAQPSPETETAPGGAREAVVWVPPPDIKPELAGSQSLSRTSTQAADCTLWRNNNSYKFFETATLEDVMACLDAGANPMLLEEFDITPLHAAAKFSDDPAVIEALLEAGADIGATTVKKGGKNTSLHTAARFNENAEIIRVLVAAGASLEARNKYDNTPLHRAANNNENPEVIKALVAAGASLEARNKYDDTPLHRAANNNENPEVIKALVAAGASLEARNKYDNTPLHHAASNNENPEVIKALVAAGASLEARSKYDNTPLHHAARFNENAEIIRVLVAAGASLEARNKYDNTPLHHAASNNENPEVIKALVAAGASLEARTKYDDTPLHHAASNNENPEVIKALLAAGANPNARGWKGKRPMDIARKRNRSILAAAGGTRKQSSGGGGLGALIAGVAVGTALGAAGAGEEEALAAGTVFAEQVRTGQQSTGGSGPASNAGGAAGGGSCEVPGYPSPPGGVANLGFAWCPASVSMQARAFALQAAGAQCAIATGSSSTSEQIQARRREIAAACERLAALGVSNCRCPAGYGP